MSVKKVLLLGAAGVAAVGMSAAMAGGFTQEPAMQHASNGYYLEGDLGVAHQNYFDATNWRLARLNDSASSKTGFAASVASGYMMNKNIGMELGWIHLPDADVTAAGIHHGDIESWALYLAGKYMFPLPIVKHTNMFFKLGVALRRADAESGVVSSTTGYVLAKNSTDFVRPIFAVGFDYSFNNMWSGVLEYTHIMGANKAFFSEVSKRYLGVQAANVFTAGVAYKFTV